MLQIIFGDDEHTALDGPYLRLMKTRKWLYIFTVGMILVQFGLYDAQAAKELIKVISLPVPFVRHSLMFGAGYLLLQYLLLLGQLASTYDIVLSERFKFRRADELAAASQRVKEQYAVLQDAKQEAAKDKTAALEKFRLSAAERESATLASFRAATAARLSADASGSNSTRERYNEHRARAAYALAKLRMQEAMGDEAENRLKLSDDPMVDAANMSLTDAQIELDHLRREVPSSRRGYTTIERVIDTARLLTPAIVATVVLGRAVLDFT